MQDSESEQKSSTVYRPGTIAKLLIFATPLVFFAVVSGFAPMIACVVPLVLALLVALTGLKNPDATQRETSRYIALGFGVVALVFGGIVVIFKLLPIVWKLLK